MSESIRLYLPWLLSAITIYQMIIAGDKKPHAWIAGLVNQCLWLIWITASQSWGLLPMNFALWVICFRNHLKWNRA